MGCNCKKKGEPVVRKYYVPATDTEPSKIIESIGVPQTPDELLSQELNKWNGGPQITVPEPQTKDEWYDQISKGIRKQDG
jgi:hypothetical protein